MKFNQGWILIIFSILWWLVFTVKGWYGRQIFYFIVIFALFRLMDYWELKKEWFV